MKNRLLVMNGQKLLQQDNAGEWETKKVEKAGGVPPGIYNLFASQSPAPATSYSGTFVHVGEGKAYQKAGRGMVAHDLAVLGEAPAIGRPVTVAYGEDGKATVSVASLKRGLSR